LSYFFISFATSLSYLLFFLRITPEESTRQIHDGDSHIVSTSYMHSYAGQSLLVTEVYQVTERVLRPQVFNWSTWYICYDLQQPKFESKFQPASNFLAGGQRDPVISTRAKLFSSDLTRMKLRSFERTRHRHKTICQSSHKSVTWLRA
jgi:hypothetical protein